MQCSKCQEEVGLTHHHLFPRVHYGKGKNNPQQIVLCTKCHRTLEVIILAIEMWEGDKPYGKRYRLSREGYIRITRKYLSDSKIVELTT